MLGAFALADACASLESGRSTAATVIGHVDAVESAFRSWLDQHAERSQR